LIGTILHRWKGDRDNFLARLTKKNSEIPTLLSQGPGATFSDHCTRIIHKRGKIIPICKDYCFPTRRNCDTNGPSITFQTCFAWTMLTPVNYICVALLRQKKVFDPCDFVCRTNFLHSQIPTNFSICLIIQ